MTRERAGDYDTKKQLILDRAAELFAGRGFDGTTMMDVARACGTSKSHLYHYFPRKEDLLFAIVSEHIQSQAVELGGIVALRRPATERFELFVQAFVDRTAQSRNEHRVLLDSLKYLPEAQRQQVRAREVELVGLVIGLLEEINPGLMAPEAARKPYAMLLFGMIIWTLTWYRKSGAIAPRELAARISQLFIGGFRDAQFP